MIGSVPLVQETRRGAEGDLCGWEDAAGNNFVDELVQKVIWRSAGLSKGNSRNADKYEGREIGNRCSIGEG